MSQIVDFTQVIRNDMNALLNVHTNRGQSRSPYAGLTSNVLPEAQRSQTGVSSEYVQKPNHEWYVLRVTYNRTEKACGIISTSGVESYMPMHYVIKKEIGKKKRILQPLLPNLFFVYTTREIANSIVKKKDEDTPILKYYLDKVRPKETNGKHPPLTIPFDAMTNFIKATSTESDHVRIVSNEQCHYKEKPFNFVDDMISGVKKYVSYLHPIDNSCGNAHLKNISLLAGGSYKQHLVLMLAAHRMDTVSLSIFKQVLESVIYYATISKIKTNVTERQFAQWCPKIREITNKAELGTFVSGQLLPVITAWKQDYKPIFLNLGIGNIQQYRIRFILGRIGRYVDVLSQGQGDPAPLNSDYIGNGIEIEHIMPNKCKNPERYGLTEEDYDQYKNKLGNLTLLEKSINASIQDDSYSSKIEAYEKSAFLLTKSISKLENVGKDTAINRTNEKLKSWVEWNAISITERQEMLFNIGEEIWAIQKKKLFD